MTFIRKVEVKKSCKDFSPSFWYRNGCRLTHLCSDAKNHWKEFDKCTGVKPQELCSPVGATSGIGSIISKKPKTNRPKPKPRPKKQVKIGLTD